MLIFEECQNVVLQIQDNFFNFVETKRILFTND